jgi:serine protease Do
LKSKSNNRGFQDSGFQLLVKSATKWAFAGLVISGVVFVGPSGWSKSGTNPPPKLIIQDTALSRDVRAGTSFAPIVKKVAPSVVNIYSTVTIHERANPLFNDPFFRRFFGGGDSPQPRDRKAESLGSGVIVSPDGYILTADHVVEGADTVKVALESGEQEFDAKVIGTDPPTDIAVLKIQVKKSLTAVTIADSDKLEVGDIVLAVGNPFAVGQTVTMGIVSAVGRGGFGINGYENFIQTDAAINPGNSGGALVDAEGRLVGINTAILSRSGGNQGVGFAVPVNMARFVMDQLVAYGKVSRGYLGINIQPLTPELAKEFHLPDESSGVLVGGVSPNSAAAKAGVEDGDVITELDGKKITDPRSLQLLVAQARPGTTVTLRLLHGENEGRPVEKTVSATLAALPQEALAAMGGGSEQGTPGKSNSNDVLDGVEVTDLDAATRRQFDVPRSVQGVLVANVDEDSYAAEAGLRAGDIIVAIERKNVHSAQEAINLSEKIKGTKVLLRIWSKSGGGTGGTRYLVVENGKPKQ